MTRQETIESRVRDCLVVLSTFTPNQRSEMSNKDVVNVIWGYLNVYYFYMLITRGEVYVYYEKWRDE